MHVASAVHPTESWLSPNFIIFICFAPDISGFVRRKWEGEGEVEAETERVRSLNYINCFCV